jgi:hypothetical protein
MRLLKLLGFFALGYLVYEFAQGLLHGSEGSKSGGWQSQRASNDDLHRALNRDPGRMNVSGPGRGTSVEVADAGGGRSNRIVGRGVVSG